MDAETNLERLWNSGADRFNQWHALSLGEQIDFAIKQKQAPKWDSIGAPENIYAAAADAYKWLIVIQCRANDIGMSADDFSRLDACMCSLVYFLPDGHEKMRIG